MNNNKSVQKKGFDNWLFKKWHFWVLIFVHIAFISENPGEVIGSIGGAFLVMTVLYGIYYMIKKPNK